MKLNEQLPSSPQFPSLLRAGESATGFPARFIGNLLTVKLTADAVDGAFSLVQNRIGARNGPPLHVHAFEEFFYILSGEFVFEAGAATLHAAAGDFLHIPGNTPHVFQNTSDCDGEVLMLARPGGVEKYFADLAELAVHNPGDLAAMNAAGAKYGITILGPPIAARHMQPQTAIAATTSSRA